MAREWINKGFTISLLESPEVGIIGVGEGSTLALKMFFDALGISEAEWVPECNATYKCGITFENWSTRPACERYFHPFSAALDRQTLLIFMHDVQARLRGADLYTHPDRFFILSRIAKQCLRAFFSATDGGYFLQRILPGVNLPSAIGMI